MSFSLQSSATHPLPEDDIEPHPIQYVTDDIEAMTPVTWLPLTPVTWPP